MHTTQSINRLFVFPALCLVVCNCSYAPPFSMDQVSLKELAKGRFRIGVGSDAWHLKNPADRRLAEHHFEVITTENSLKMNFVQPSEGRWQLDKSQPLVDDARSSGIAVVGHCLLWAQYNQTPDWMFSGRRRDHILGRLKFHVSFAMKHYRGKIHEWDVVNEALSDKDNEFLRPNKWLHHIGDDYITRCFKYARAADPNAMLIYNDYSCEYPAKRAKLLRLIDHVRNQGGEIDAVGLQGHYEVGQVPLQELQDTIDALRKKNVKVIISELDVDVVSRQRHFGANVNRQSNQGANPYPKSCPPEVLKQQAKDYENLFRLFCKNSDIIDRVSFWNLHDGQSWLNSWPWKRTNYPLLFDRNRQPKPAFDAVVRVLSEK